MIIIIDKLDCQFLGKVIEIVDKLCCSVKITQVWYQMSIKWPSGKWPN